MAEVLRTVAKSLGQTPPADPEPVATEAPVPAMTADPEPVVTVDPGPGIIIVAKSRAVTPYCIATSSHFPKSLISPVVITSFFAMLVRECCFQV